MCFTKDRARTITNYTEMTENDLMPSILLFLLNRYVITWPWSFISTREKQSNKRNTKECTSFISTAYLYFKFKCILLYFLLKLDIFISCWPGPALMCVSTNKNNRGRNESSGKYICQCDYKLAIINHVDLSQFHRDEINHTYTPDTCIRNVRTQWISTKRMISKYFWFNESVSLRSSMSLSVSFCLFPSLFHWPNPFWKCLLSRGPFGITLFTHSLAHRLF